MYKTANDYYKEKANYDIPLEERIYLSSNRTEFYYMYRPQGNLKQGAYDYDGPIKAVYTDGKGNYYYAQNNSKYKDFIMQSEVALLVQSSTYANKKVDAGDGSDLGIRPIYQEIQYNDNTYTFQNTEYSGTDNAYRVVYSSGSETIYISKNGVKSSSDITEDFYANMKPIGDPIGYVSHNTTIDSEINPSSGKFDYDFEYVLMKENVMLNDGVNPAGPYTLFVKPETGYFLYEDTQGNVYVPKGYEKNLRSLTEVNYTPQSETGIYSYHITKSKIADLIGIEESKINIDNYTVSELNCKVDDLVNTYDLVIIGGDVSALREFKNNNKTLSTTYQRKMTVKDEYAYDMYYHTGDIIQRNSFYEDKPDSVLIGTQRNKNGKYVYVNSGMDLSYTKQHELYTYINSGRPVLIEAEVISGDNTVSKRIDPASYIGVMLSDIANGKKSNNYQNILTGFDYDDYKTVDGKTVYNDNTKSSIVATINSDVSIIRPTLNIISKPVEYEETKAKSEYAKNGHKFIVEYNIGSEAGNGMDYDVNLYFDVDMDGRFSENEIYATQEYRTGRDKNMFIEYELVDTFFGILSWKLEATYHGANNAITQVSQLGYAGFDRDAKYNNNDEYLETIKVLQIIPKVNANLEMCVECDSDSSNKILNHNHTFGIREYVGTSSKGGTNQGNLMDGFVFKDYFDIQLTLQTCDDFCAEVWDNTQLPASSVKNENWLIDKYDMIVIGFADSFGEKDFTKVACQELVKFSEVNGLLCSHDNIGIVNSGAVYDNDLYNVGNSQKDPDMYVRKPKTTWSYNMSHYYNPGDKVYNTSVRYIYGAARFFTVDKNDMYTNSQDGTEFYTNYGVDYGPTSDFVGGIFGGQADACLGWRIGADTSSYKNTNYVGSYNHTFVVDTTNDGIITRYPFALPDRFSTVETHSQYAQLDLDIESTTVWYTLDTTMEGVDPILKNGSLDVKPENSIYTISPNDGRNNYYIYSNKNVTYTGAGHADIVNQYNNNYERKLFINTVFLSFNSRNNAPVIRLEGDGITEIAKSEVEEGKRVDAKVTVPTVDSTLEFELDILDDLLDREFTGLIFINKNPNEVDNNKTYNPSNIEDDYYDPKEDILLGIIQKGSNDDGYVYYDLIRFDETRKITGIQMQQSYFDKLTSTTHISIEIFDRVPEDKGNNFREQRTVNTNAKTKHSLYTIRVVAESIIDIDLWELN